MHRRVLLILATKALEANTGLCLDNAEERAQLADTLAHLLGTVQAAGRAEGFGNALRINHAARRKAAFKAPQRKE